MAEAPMAPKIVLISGCSSGMGLATAVFLAKDAEKRFKVYATMRNLAKKGQLEEEGKEYLADTLIIKQMDVCSDESVEKAVKEVLDTEGRIDVLFNNAGVPLFGSVECIPISVAKEVFDVNFFGAVRLIKALLPSMKARQSGHIIINSSTTGIVGFPFVDIYAASKFAVEGLCESMASVLRQFDIRFTILEPGPVETDIAHAAEEIGKTVNFSAADQKTQTMMTGWMAGMHQMLQTAMKASEIAAIVKDIILSKSTNFRCQANADAEINKVIAAKLKDPVSGESIELMEKYLSDTIQKGGGKLD
ncbi:hypothetical protein OS493_000424 [Desmophyllum pertusum]|uniref:Retinol dehydrogenase 8 n=1 Tax=Desmophyllum pertusum TaxID=174260 RepID=A0A9X0A704_9CNID|nr:hypothetical protein OS493_000424 [Desmophyllum pertusum]